VSANTSTSPTPGPVVANPNPVNFTGTGQSQTVGLSETNYSGAYSLKTSPNTSVASASIAGNAITVTANGYGQTSFYVAGGASLYTNVVVNVVAPGPVTANPASLSFDGVGQQKSTAVSETNYSGAYTITGAPDSTIATASIVGNTVTVTSVGPGSTSVTVSGAAGHSVTVPINVPKPGVVDIFPNDTLSYPSSGNKLTGCTYNQPLDPTQANVADPDSGFVAGTALSFDANGCELVNGSPVDQLTHYSVHVHETGFYGTFQYKVSSGCGAALSGVEISSATGPDALVRMHGTVSVAGTVSCIVTITGWKGNGLSNVQVTVKIGTPPQ
jgi:hypothetical protein